MDYKSILGDKYSTDIEKALKDSVGKEFIPKEQYNKKIDELTTKTDELKTNNEQMEKLQKDFDKYSKSDETIEELKKKLDDTSKEYETFKNDTGKRETNRTKLDALKKGFDGKINKDSLDLIANTYNLDDITIDSKGNVVDLDVMMEGLKTSRPSLIVAENLENTPPPEGGEKGKVDWSKLSDQEYFDQSIKKE